MAINFVKNDDIRILRDIEQYYSTQIDEMPMNSECPALENYSAKAIRKVVGAQCVGTTMSCMPLNLKVTRSCSCEIRCCG